MESHPWLFFSFWAVISITFLHLGYYYALDKIEPSDLLSLLVMSFFKHCLAVSSCFSSNYALITRRLSGYEEDRRYFWLMFGILPAIFNNQDIYGTLLWIVLLCILIWLSAWLLVDSLPILKIFTNKFWPIAVTVTIISFFPTACFPWYLPIFTLVNFILIIAGDKHLKPEMKIRMGIHMAAETSLFLVGGENTKFFPILVLLGSFFVAGLWTETSASDRYSRVYADPLSMEKNQGKLIEFAIGMVATILFQNYFRLSSFKQVAGFLCLAVMWMANLALLGASRDFGVFNFLLGNVVVSCTVSGFGLRTATWLAYGASLLLFNLRLKLESLSLELVESERYKITYRSTCSWFCGCYTW